MIVAGKDLKWNVGRMYKRCQRKGWWCTNKADKGDWYREQGEDQKIEIQNSDQEMRKKEIKIKIIKIIKIKIKINKNKGKNS